MKRWFDRYMPYFGDFTKFPPEVFAEIKEKLHGLEKGRDKPEVSVVVIAHNEEQRLLPCIWSLANMTSKYAIEIIVVDNGSTDRTSEVIKLMGVRTVLQPKLGHGNARQAGLDISRGVWHFTADADSLYPPTYIDGMMTYLKNPKVSVVFTPYGFYPDGKKSNFQLLAYEIFRDVVVGLRSINRPELSAGGAAMAFLAAHGRAIGWRKDILRGEDGSMVLALKTCGNPKFVLNRKVRIASSSRTLDADGGVMKMIWKRLKKELGRIPAFFTKKDFYEDGADNLRKDQ